MSSHLKTPPRFLIKLDKWYFDWSANLGAPVSWGLTEDELVPYMNRVYGMCHERTLNLDWSKRQLQRHGTDCGVMLGSVLQYNRAGLGGTTLTLHELLIQYTRPLYRHKPTNRVGTMWSSKARRCDPFAHTHFRSIDGKDLYDCPLWEFEPL